MRRGRVLVVPFENARDEPRFHWLSEAAAVLLTDGLRTSGSGAIVASQRVRAFEQLYLRSPRRSAAPPSSRSDSSSARPRSSSARTGRRRRSGHGAQHSRRPRPPAARGRRAWPADGVVRHLRAARRPLGPGGCATGRCARSASSARRVRELHQGTGGGEPGLAGVVSRSGASGRAVVRSGAPGAVGSPHRAGRPRGRARGGPRRAVHSRRSFHARFFAGISLIELKRYDEALSLLKTSLEPLPAEPGRQRRRAQQLRRADPAPRDDAPGGHGGVLPDQGDRRRSRPRLHVQPGVRLRAGSQLSGRALLAARGAAPGPGRRRRALRAGGRASGDSATPSRRRANAISRGSSPRDTKSWTAARRTSGARAAGPRADSAGPRGVVGAARRSDDRQLGAARTARAGRRSISNRGAACSSASRIARRSPSCAGPSTCRPTRRARTCSSAASTCAAGRPADAVDAFKISIWSEDHAPAHVSLAEAYLKTGDRPTPARKRSARWCSTRGPPTPSGCCRRSSSADTSSREARSRQGDRRRRPRF